MLESILIAVGRGKCFPNSGPGPLCLIGGDEIAGFFGETTTTELISGTGLASMIGLTDGTVQNNTSPWLKFFIDDKIVFIAKKSYRHSTTWDQINAANAVYGDRIIDIKGYQFKVSLIKGLNPDPSVPFVNNSYDNECTWNSEWNRLMYHVAINIPTYPKTSQVGPNWANYPQDNSADGLNITAGDGKRSWCQETPPGQPTTRVVRGYYSVSNSGRSASSLVYAGSGWRPRLELVTQ